MKVSVIVPTLNEEENILACIASAKRSGAEVIVVDSFSKDKTFEIAKKYADIAVQRKTNIPKARNLGAKLAKGDILFFCDADTRFSKNCIKQMIECLKKADGCMAFLYPYGCSVFAKMLFIAWMLCLKLLSIFGLVLFVGACCAFKKDFFQRFRFNEKLRCSEDYDLSMRASRYGRLIHCFKARAYVRPKRFKPFKLLLYFLNGLYFILKRKNLFAKELGY